VEQSQTNEKIQMLQVGRFPVGGGLLALCLHRFTLRGKAKVNGQWKLYCMMHNIEKWK